MIIIYLSRISKFVFPLAILLMAITFDLHAQTNKPEEKPKRNEITSYYANYSFDEHSDDKFIIIGMNVIQYMDSTFFSTTYFTPMFDLSFMGGFDGSKDNYLINFAIGQQLNSFGPYDMRFYLGFLGGFSALKSPVSDKLFGGINAQLLLGFGYKSFSIELSSIFISTKIRSFEAAGFGLRFSFGL